MENLFSYIYIIRFIMFIGLSNDSFKLPPSRCQVLDPDIVTYMKNRKICCRMIKIFPGPHSIFILDFVASATSIGSYASGRADSGCAHDDLRTCLQGKRNTLQECPCIQQPFQEALVESTTLFQKCFCLLYHVAPAMTACTEGEDPAESSLEDLISVLCCSYLFQSYSACFEISYAIYFGCRIY